MLQIVSAAIGSTLGVGSTVIVALAIGPWHAPFCVVAFALKVIVCGRLLLFSSVKAGIVLPFPLSCVTPVIAAGTFASHSKSTAVDVELRVSSALLDCVQMVCWELLNCVVGSGCMVRLKFSGFPEQNPAILGTTSYTNVYGAKDVLLIIAPVIFPAPLGVG